MIKEYEVSSLQEFIDILDKIPTNYILSRGQTDDFDLLPSSLRKDKKGNRLYSKTTIRKFLDDFKLNSLIYIDNSYDVKSDYDWMLYAQHYGVPTNLLDFTFSHIISLMFSVEKAFDYDDDDTENSVVWFLDPYDLNNLSIHRSEIINLSIDSGIQLDNYEKPVAVCANKNNCRINAQNGLFVYFQDDSDSLNEVLCDKKALIKVKIPHNATKRIIKNLFLLGLRFNSLYPELTSISKDILLKKNIDSYLQEQQEI